MSIDVSEVLAAIADGQSATVVVAVAVAVAYWAVRSVKMLRDDGSADEYYGHHHECPECGEWGGDDDASCIEEYGCCMGCYSGSVDVGSEYGVDYLVCVECMQAFSDDRNFSCIGHTDLCLSCLVEHDAELAAEAGLE